MFPLISLVSCLKKLLFDLFPDVFLSCTTENRGVSFDDNPVNKLLIQAKNNKGPRVGELGRTWGTPAFTTSHPKSLIVYKYSVISINKKVFNDL